MTQLGLDLDLTTKRTRKREFLDVSLPPKNESLAER
jgi:hypothetical protein